MSKYTKYDTKPFGGKAGKKPSKARRFTDPNYDEVDRYERFMTGSSIDADYQRYLERIKGGRNSK